MSHNKRTMAITPFYYSSHASRPSYSQMYESENGTCYQHPVMQRPPYSKSTAGQSALYPAENASSQTQNATLPQPHFNYVAYLPPYHSTPPSPIVTSTYQQSSLPNLQVFCSSEPAYQMSQPCIPALVAYTRPRYQAATTSPAPSSQLHPPVHIECLTECPSSKGPDGLMFTTTWYRFRGAPGFTICSYCYATKIARMYLASDTECYEHDSTMHREVLCNFNTMRVDRLLEKALRTGNAGELLLFAQRRGPLSSCPGSTKPVTIADGVRWFGIAKIPEFTCCEACYEDFAVDAPFITHFGPHQLQHRFESGEAWFCNMAEYFIRRTFIECVKAIDWASFVGWTWHRMSIADCEGTKEVDAASRKWYKPNGIDGMRVCEACYLDYTGNTAIGGNFREISNKWHQTPTARCDFGQLSVQLCSAALIEKDFSRWHQLIARMMSLPECSDTVQDGEFFTLTNPGTGTQTDFGICERCLLGFMESSGHGNGRNSNPRTMWTETRFSGLARCDLHQAAARFTKFVAKYAEMVFTGHDSVLTDYVVRMETVKSCPGSTITDDHERLWWGMDDFFFCEECYEDFGKDTFFASSFRWQGRRCGNSKCDMHSPNMRRRYTEACQQRSLVNFMHYCHDRTETWKQLQALKASQQSANQHNMSMGMSQLIAATNGKHNAAMWGIGNVGGDYNSWYDPNYQHAQWQSTQAWNEITGGIVSSSVVRSQIETKWKDVE